jgi:hypothetical protein
MSLRPNSLDVAIPASARVRRGRSPPADEADASDSSQSSEVYSSDEGSAGDAMETAPATHKPKDIVTESVPAAPWPEIMLSSSEDTDAYYSSALFGAVEWGKFACGCGLLLFAGPYVALQIFVCNMWNELDMRVLGMIPFVQRMSLKLAPYSQFLVKHKDDGFISHLLLWLGVVLPAWFFYELYHAHTYGLSLGRVLFYNIVRIGPMYVNFMNVYVMCHKEGHNFGNLFAKRFNGVFPVGFGLKYVFNHWAGLFHGVLPGTFTYSHLYNHHKYDNDERDVYSTAYRPRDRFTSWVTYLPEWFAYASNVSSIRAFCQEGKWNWAAGSALGTAGYVAFVAACWKIHPTFTLLTLVYAFVEGNILLSIVNFVWHGFIDPNDPSNDYVNSTTVVEGLNFTLAEEYHVVHHQYAGAHWTRHQELYLKHAAGYKECVPTAFYKQNLGFIFGYMITQDYAKLAEHYYAPLWPKGMSNAEMQELMRKRLQCHGPALARRVGRTHKAKNLAGKDGREKAAGKKE